MADLKSYYRDIFDAFGYPLSARTQTPAREIAAAEQRLGITIPPALRAYHLVAGRERRFNQCHNRILKPKQVAA